MAASLVEAEEAHEDALEEKRRLEERYAATELPVAPMTSERSWQLPSVPTLLREHVFPRVPNFLIRRNRVREVTEEEGIKEDEKVALLE